QTKRRPALVISALEGDDVILCHFHSPICHSHGTCPRENGEWKSIFSLP
ncbi:unnamed protein product, partial [marine sediment metagenome]